MIFASFYNFLHLTAFNYSIFEHKRKTDIMVVFHLSTFNLLPIFILCVV